MNSIPVILDCDPGVDDAIAIMLAHKLPKLKLLALTSVAGNVGVEHTTRNALRILEFIGADVPVYRGAAGPLYRNQIDAAEIHGAEGLAGFELPCSREEVKGTPAWDAIYEQALKHKGELEIIAVGPLTNLALAFLKYPNLADLIKRIVIMGGSTNMGNTTPAAEFNILADPEAADLVFCSGVPVYMCGLDVTMQAFLSAEEIEQIGALGSKEAKLFRDLVQDILKFLARLGIPGMHMHDPAAVLFAADDSIFEYHAAGIRVETRGRLSQGKTVTDLYSDAKWEKNGFVVTGVDREVFKKRVFELMAEYN